MRRLWTEEDKDVAKMDRMVRKPTPNPEKDLGQQDGDQVHGHGRECPSMMSTPRRHLSNFSLPLPIDK